MGDLFYDGLDTEEPVEKPRATPGLALVPVSIEHTQVCKFKARACGNCGKTRPAKAHKKGPEFEHEYVKKMGCANCGKPKGSPDHVGAPASVNAYLQASIFAYRAAKEQWHKTLRELLEKSELPGGLESVMVEGEVSFGPPEKVRDQGNHRFLIEKALGDVLVEEGYLPDDSWERYEFGRLELVEEGVSRIRLTLFPTA